MAVHKKFALFCNTIAVSFQINVASADGIVQYRVGFLRTTYRSNGDDSVDVGNGVVLGRFCLAV
jgi:hypothetical protein